MIVDSAISGRKLERPWLGAKLDAVTRELGEALALERVAGALVVKVYEHSAAAEAGLLSGDVIVAVDGYEIPDPRAVYYRLTTRGIGNKCSLDVVRKGHKMTVRSPCVARPKPARDDVRNLSGTHPFDGARVANILPGTAAELGLEEEDGVVILSVQPASRSARLGFRTGDIIVQIGREKIDSIGDLEAQLKERPRVWQVVVKRGNQLLQLQLSG